MRVRQENTSEPIWEGRLHVGDEPGIYGDAAYAGLAIEFPITVLPFDSGSTKLADITFEITANRVKIYAPYTGHPVTLFAYDPVPGSNPPTWSRRQVGQALMDKDSVRIQPTQISKERYFSIRLEVATDSTPGLYDDIVVQTLTLQSSTHYADFGFRFA